MTTDSPPVRIGLLGASRIAPLALVAPARENPATQLVAVAARDELRAQAFAAHHSIETCSPSYHALLERDDIDLVYIALPVHLHETWTIAALDSGKHVLLEKPSGPCAEAAARMVAAATRNRRRLIEAFHYRYHPLMHRVLQLAHGGELGKLQSVDVVIDVPVPRREGEIRWSAAAAGGALMDLGCYPVHWLRSIGGEFQVRAARIAMADSGVDQTVDAEVAFAGGATGTLRCSMIPHERGRLTSIQLLGTRGELFVRNPIAPQMGHELRWRQSGDWISEPQPMTSSYAHQLQAVIAALASGEPLPTEGDDIVHNMQAIDAIYAAGGISRDWR